MILLIFHCKHMIISINPPYPPAYRQGRLLQGGVNRTPVIKYYCVNVKDNIFDQFKSSMTTFNACSDILCSL